MKPWSLEQLVEGCARAGITAIAPWRDIVQACGVERAGKLIRAHGPDRHRPLPRRHVSRRRRGRPPRGARRQPPRGRRSRRHRRAVPRPVVGGLPKGSTDIAGARRQVRDGLAALLPYARAANVPLAIEPLHPMYAADRACVNTLAHANDLCDELGEGDRRRGRRLSRLVGPRPARARSRAPAQRILAYHVCDWLVPTTDLLLDRGMMGDGVIDLRAIRAHGGGDGLSRPLRGGDLLRRRTGGSASPTRCCASASSATGRWCDGTAGVALSCPGRASAQRERRSGTQEQQDCYPQLCQRPASRIWPLGPGSRFARPGHESAY